ncbi:MAG: triose-phosphate isomerase [SAR202 cluster bacterium]|nr:triose-phosphate isomerase [SAR202 cluster bacterium]|tara:strand:+ start:2448 stop:3203 length:756 start_codon:yes stop_codon:yes gene_type:complete
MSEIIVAANWKMNKTVTESNDLVKEILKEVPVIDSVTCIVFPPFLSLPSVANLIKGSSIKLGAQNMHSAQKGAFTGEVSGLMLQDYCSYVLLGHSERRVLFGETDEFVNEKLAGAIEFGLRPIVCVGEQSSDRARGLTENVIRSQIKNSLKDIEGINDIIVAYEPVWAIGTGTAASPEDAEEVNKFIRDELALMFGSEKVLQTPILYGGSVTEDNIAEFLAKPNVNGALIGGASLSSEGFTQILQNACNLT